MFEQWTTQDTTAVLLTLRVALCCVGLLLLPGVFLGWLLARKQFIGRSWLEAAIHLPLVLPPVVVGYGLLVLTGRQSWIGSFFEQTLGLPIAFTWLAAVLASSVMALPLMVRTVKLAIESVDKGQEQAASVCGASPWRVWWTITFPAAWPGLLTGMILAFARSVGEFGATITFAGNIEGHTRTLPLAIFSAMQRTDGDASVHRLVIASIILSLAAVFVSEWMSRKYRDANLRSEHARSRP
ncbi:MAG TPA: molybdate ABC transporter permease subunit [Phycisphaerales bacterium]|nr:molybdate ABC transporter permease subunit [Phycisphaerales bacterium]HCD31804.1 molybdate ABC transporter permease subunit [Phycisphaerales bacterium]|tara:strand:- start:12534 stop:13253 length:720 start_codon:yes stop_codon:yes gene_type:complete